MSASVWLREVNVGFLQELKDTVRINKKGVLSELPDKAFIVRKPEEDFKFETFPCVSIYIKDYQHDPIRTYPHTVKMGEDIENKQVLMEDPAVAFNIDMQVDFWSRYQEDMDEMLKSWLLKHFRQFNLRVVDDGGTERTCNVNQIPPNGSIVKSDLVLNKERLFHTIINYVIWVELDAEFQYNIPMVITREMDIQQKN